ncbi:MAG: hypothetical protein QM805_07750 [Pseudomonas sp.]
MGQMQNPGEARATTIVLTDLQSGNDLGLEPGTVFEVNGFLKVSMLNAPNITGTGTDRIGGNRDRGGVKVRWNFFGSL